jgi:hypothetical protein
MHLDEYTLADIAMWMYDPADIRSIRLTCKDFAHAIPVDIIEPNHYVILNRMIRNVDMRDNYVFTTPEMLAALMHKYTDIILSFDDQYTRYIFKHMSTAHMLAIAPHTGPCDYDDFMNYMGRAFVKEGCTDEACANITAIADVYSINDVFFIFGQMSDIVARISAARKDLTKHEIICEYVQDASNMFRYDENIGALLREMFCPNVIFDPTIHDDIINIINETMDECMNGARAVRLIATFGYRAEIALFRSCHMRQTDLTFWTDVRAAMGLEAFATRCAYHANSIQQLVDDCFSANVHAFWRNVFIKDCAIDLLEVPEVAAAAVHICYPTDAAATLIKGRMGDLCQLVDDLPRDVNMYKWLCANGMITTANCISTFMHILLNYQKFIQDGRNPETYLDEIVRLFPNDVRELRGVFINMYGKGNADAAIKTYLQTY